MAYYKVLSSGKDVSFVNISGWENPGVTFSTEKLEYLLEQLAVIGDDMISSKEGKAGESFYFIESELNSLVRSAKEWNSN